MVFSDTGLLDQMIQKHLAEAARMRDWQADVLIEVKDFYFLPIDAGHFRQRIRQITSRCSTTMAVITCCLMIMAGTGRNELIAQTIQVDTTPSHVVNTFSPLYALGTTVDRVPSNATDVFFAPDQIKQVVSA